MFHFQKVSTLLLVFFLFEIKGDCIFSVKSDLGSPQPLYLKPKNATFYLPENRDGDIRLRQSEIIDVQCPGGSVKVRGQNSRRPNLQIRCVANKKFEVPETSQTANIDQFACTRTLSSARYTNRTCLHGNHSEIEVGFQTTSSRFIKTLDICFDRKLQNVQYSHFNLTKEIKGFQYDNPRPQFDDAGFYNLGKHQVYTLYSVYIQRLNLNRQLGLPAKSEKYIKSGDFSLQRGHLTARADFVYGTQQNATFYYVNVAPQWGAFNKHNWQEVEKSVRDYASFIDRDLEVFTGTHGLATLPHASTQKATPLYLYDESDRNALPVPRAYWKVVYDRRNKAGVAFIGLNNPYERAVSPDIYCTDICAQLNRWRFYGDRKNVTHGYTYCCDVNDLRRRVKNVPNFTVNKLLD